MGNKPDRSRKTQQPYNQMVEDAIAALKDRPRSSQADIFNYLEAKYEGKISPNNRKNLQTVIRSVIQTKKRSKPSRPASGARRRFGGRLKATPGRGRRKFGLGRGGGRVRSLTHGGGSKGLKMKFAMPKSLSKSFRAPKTLKMGRSKGSAGHGQLLQRAKRGSGRGGKPLLRPAGRTTSEGSMCLSGRMRRN